MQPYFLPYLGYFQLMEVSDVFVIYDNIQFTKKGWIHRNRMLMNNKDMMFGIPLKNDSDFLNVDQRVISDNFATEKNKVLGQIRSSYSKAPFFREVFPVIEEIFNNKATNLFVFIYESILAIRSFLSIATPLVISSSLPIDHTLRGKDKVIAIIKQLGGDIYINPIGGMELYNKDDFKEHGIDLHFHKMRPVVYAQNSKEFLPSLSILDVMMFNGADKTKKLLTEYDLV